MTRRVWTGRSVTPLLSRDDCDAIAKKVYSLAPSGMRVRVTLAGGIGASTSFARGDIRMASETSGVVISVGLSGSDRKGGADGTRVDDEGLRELVAEAEMASREWRGKPNPPPPMTPRQFKTPPKLFFEKNLPLMEPGGRGEVMSAALDGAEAAGLIGAGSLGLSRSARAVMNNEGLFGYAAETRTDFSLTARTKDGTGSGWAWGGYEDWSRVDTKSIIARAVDLAERSKNPVAVEPGRYTVILEPAAVGELIMMINWDAWSADRGDTVFSKDPIGTNKIGLQMMDRRLHMVSDPWDSEAPRSTFGYNGESLDRVQWFKDGFLRELEYGEWYAKQKNRLPAQGSYNLRLWGTGPTQTLDEMIANTKRGIWVNRLTGMSMMNARTCLLSGTTRDGTFLIENGKITKAIKNFRFTESPFFAFNKLEAFGDPVRANGWAIAPRMKVRDFDFTSLTDAV